MSENTKIEWTDATWNPIRARNLKTGKLGWHCEHESEACRFCYAETRNVNTFFGNGLAYKPGHRKDIKMFLDDNTLTKPLRWRKPRKIFVCSMTDLFADFVNDEWIDRMFAVMALCPQHTFQVLTKRPERMRAWFSEKWQGTTAQRIDFGGGDILDVPAGSDTDRHEQVFQACDSIFELVPALADTSNDALWSENGSLKCRQFVWPLPNVWLGTSCEDRATLLDRSAHLRATPAAVRFYSLEPLLGDLGEIPFDGITWTISGGESGKNARPMHPAWPRDIRDQCKASGVPFLFKQWGEWAPEPDWYADHHTSLPMKIFGPNGWTDDGSVEGEWLVRVGKKRAGRLLDGIEHNGYPRT